MNDLSDDAETRLEALRDRSLKGQVQCDITAYDAIEQTQPDI